VDPVGALRIDDVGDDDGRRVVEPAHPASAADAAPATSPPAPRNRRRL
jgi:hypothetical protein